MQFKYPRKNRVESLANEFDSDLDGPQSLGGIGARKYPLSSLRRGAEAEEALESRELLTNVWRMEDLNENLKRRDEITNQKRERYYLKAMNCPHHHKLFGAVPRSYRDLPLRLAEYGTCYRYEQSGELFGLMRVRAMQMNDAHIYCTEEQFAAEFEAVNQMYLKYFKIFGIERYQFRFSTHDPKELGKKFVDQSDLWLKTEKMVRDVLIASGAPYVEVPNEAAFYGPKIDIQIWNIIGKEFTLATNQVDFAVPARFGLTYKDRDNSRDEDPALHPPRPARHARAASSASSSNTTPATSRSGSAPSRSAVPCPSATKKSRSRITPRPSRPNYAPTAYAPNSTPAPTRSKPRSPAPRR